MKEGSKENRQKNGKRVIIRDKETQTERKKRKQKHKRSHMSVTWIKWSKTGGYGERAK